MALTAPGSAFQRNKEKEIEKPGHFTKSLRPLPVLEGYRPPSLRNVYIIKNIKLGWVAYNSNPRI